MAHWHDINSPGVYQTKSKETASPTSAQADESTGAQQESPIEYKIISLEAIEPPDGFQVGKPYDIEGEIEPLVDKITQPRVLLYPKGMYSDTDGNSSVDDFFPGGIEAFPDKNNIFRCTCKKFFSADAYDRDDDKSEDAFWELIISAEGKTAEKQLQSTPIRFPRTAQAAVNLRKGHYDIDGAQNYDQPQSGTDYVDGDAVLRLQRDLIELRFLPKNEDDGFFGSKTDSAVRDFQYYAIEKFRMPRKAGKLIEVEQTLPQSQPDGIVGPKTRDELARWKQKEWIKPLLILRRGDYDDNGIELGSREKGGDDHHIQNPVITLQRRLRERGFAHVGADDGWFGDKTKTALMDFQTAAADNTRVVNQSPVQIESVTFAGSGDGVFNEQTRKELDLWEANDYFYEHTNDDDWLIYLPEKQCYFLIDKSLQKRFKESTEKCNSLSGEISDHIASCAKASTEQERKALAEKGLELEEKVKQFAGPTKKPTDMIKEIVSLTPMNSGNSKVIGNLNYLESDFINEMQSRAIHGNDPDIKKRIKRLVKQTKPGIAAKGSVWKSEQVEADWPDIWNYNGKHEAKSEHIGKNFGYSAEAQWMRFVAGASLDAEFNLSERKVTFGGQGSVEYILGKGEVKGSFFLPDSDGVNIFTFFAISENARNIIRKENVTLRLRIEYQAKGYVYAGAAASALVALPSIQLNEEAQEAKIEAGGSIGATADIGGELAHLVQWSEKNGVKDFKDLTKVFAQAEGSVGAAAEGKIICGYVKNRNGSGVFRFSIGAKVVLGLGAKCATGFDLGLEAGAELIAHMLYLVKSHKLEALMEEAYRAACLFVFGKAVAIGRGMESAAEGIFERFTDAVGAVREMGEDIVDELQEFKGDFFDGIGRIQKDLQNPYTLAVGLLVAVRRYEDGDFDKILNLLKQTRTDDKNHELKWMLRYISGVSDKEEGVNAGVRKLMDFGLSEIGHRQYQQDLRTYLLNRGITW